MSLIPVMIVDDEFIVRIGLKSIVEWEKLGFRIVAEAANGMDALEKFKTYQPKLMFIDINMPVINGIDLMREIRKQEEDVYFVVLSAYDSFAFAQEAIKVNAVEYILKASLLKENMEELLKRLYLTISGVYNKKAPPDKKESETHIIEGIENSNIDHNQLEMLFTKSVPGEVHKDIWYFRLKGVVQETGRNTILKTMESMLENIFKSSGIKAAVLKGSKYLIVISESIDPGDLAVMIDNIFLTFENYIQHKIMLGMALNMKETLDTGRYLQMARTASYNLVLAPGEKYMIYDGNSPKYLLEDERQILALTGLIRKNFSIRSVDGIFDRLEDLFAFVKKSGDYNMLCKAVLQLSSITSEHLPVSDNILPDSILELDDIHRMHKEFIRYFEIIINNIEGNGRNYDVYVKDAKKYIEENLNKELTLKNISKILHVSPNYLGKVFHKSTGKRVSDYIAEVRIDKACEFMKDRKYSLQQIAEIIGIENQQYFSKIFKDLMGQSPKDYRKKIKC